MVIQGKSRTLNLRAPLPIYLLAAASSIVLALLVVLLAGRTVHADTNLPAQQSFALRGSDRLHPVLAAPAHEPLEGSVPGAATGQNGAEGTKIGAKAGKTPRLHGIASWYGGIFDGRKTASGETYNMYAMTACHPTLPFGTVVRVVNRLNHKSVVVRINDRGDLVNRNRIIDLSYGAAEKLAMVRSGLAPVDIQVLSPGKNGEQ